LMLALQSLAGGSSAEDLPVVQDKVSRRQGNQYFDALLYRPSGVIPERAIVLIAGLSELGCYHPRLMAFSRSLADKGFLVLTPDISMFRQFQIAPEAMDEIVFWFEQVKTLPGANKIRCIGLGGISFSGTLALITAVRPEIREQVAYLLAIGPYDDPLRCSRGWFATGPVTVGPGYYPTRFYAKWIIIRAALDMLPVAEERRFMHEVLGNLLLQKHIPQAPPNLSPQAARWYRLALMREDESDPELARQIEEHLAPRLYRRIVPERAATEVRCPVFLVHGAHDDLIPPEESLALRARITHARSYLLVSPFLTHTHPLEKPLLWKEKLRGMIEIFAFFYSFARVVW
jgi:pimeloyl-ACP methyl ester carboxylesterase